MRIKSTIFAILMTFAAMPAWGMDENDNLTLIRLPKDQRDSIAEEIFRDSLSGSARDALYNKNIETHILQLNGITVGFITHKNLRDQSLPARHIAHLAVAENYRRRGFASFMINEIEEQARHDKVAIIEISYDQDVLEYYEKRGYTQDPMHACTVMKTL